jgi:hypothetical protein
MTNGTCVDSSGLGSGVLIALLGIEFDRRQNLHELPALVE